MDDKDGLYQAVERFTLEEFAGWFLKNSSVIASVPLHGAVSKIEDVTSVLMYRGGSFQVQMFIVPADYIIPEHTHPNVDSLEIYMGGQIRFSHSGKWVISDDEFFNASPDEQRGTGLPQRAGHAIRVRPDELHGGIFGPSGGVFLSIQHWLNGVKPHCVAADYIGVVMGKHHLDSVKNGSPVLKEKLSFSDAAHGEPYAQSKLMELHVPESATGN